MDKMQKTFRFKELLDALPMNTMEAKRQLSAQYNIHPRKIDRWYRGEGKTNIKLSDALCLVKFFGLADAESLYHSPAKQKPIKAIS